MKFATAVTILSLATASAFVPTTISTSRVSVLYTCVYVCVVVVVNGRCSK